MYMNIYCLNILEIFNNSNIYYSTRLNSLVEGQPRNKKSRRCVLHSLEIQRMRPPPSAWKEVWDCMDHSCRLALSLIESNSLEATLDTYLRKHR